MPFSFEIKITRLNWDSFLPVIGLSCLFKSDNKNAEWDFCRSAPVFGLDYKSLSKKPRGNNFT